VPILISQPQISGNRCVCSPSVPVGMGVKEEHFNLFFLKPAFPENG
jgi:hypothetical protein